tara:strand:- start:4782 stop:5333 length:552 start_codon:yes stop_codon:yes gene_type:complete
MSKTQNGKNEPTVIKKYANRRLYDTGRSSYITLDDLCEMVKDGYDFVVYDAKSGDDITHSVLTQIIADQESKGENLLPTSFLKNLIGFYGDNIQALVPNYLEQSFDTFVKNQEQLREQVNKSLETMGVGVGDVPNMFPQMKDMPKTIEEVSRKNMEMIESAMKLWAPFGSIYTSEQKKPAKKD